MASNRAAYQAAYWQKNQDRLREYRRQYYLRNRERHQAQMRVVNYRLRYGITVDEYDQMLAEQGGGCKICGATEGYNGKRLSVDHDHETNNVRGLLCDRCNLIIGKADSEVLQAALLYLAIDNS